jgi:hypothetical protein
MAFADYCGNVPVPKAPTELEAPPASAWSEEAPATEPNASPGLDLMLLAGAERHLSACQSFTAGGQHHVAMVHAREALNRLLQAIGMSERQALLDRLVDDAESILSSERDTREPEVRP